MQLRKNEFLLKLKNIKIKAILDGKYDENDATIIRYCCGYSMKWYFKQA